MPYLRADFCSDLRRSGFLLLFENFESHGNMLLTHACTFCIMASLYSPCTKKAAFFLNELEAKLMGCGPGLSKTVQIHRTWPNLF